MELINSITKQWVDAYIKRPKAALIINTNNDNKSGLKIAQYIYEELRNNKNVPLFKLEITSKKSIGIDDIRDIQSYLALKASFDGKYTRFIVISEAEKLTKEAQNALLKLLEELPKKTVLMLIVNDNTNMLQTINSRCFNIKVLPISQGQATDYGVKINKDINQINKAYLISEGNRENFIDILNGKNLIIEDLINIAKDFIKSPVIERQKILESLNKKDIITIEFLQSLELTARTGMRYAKDASTKNHWKSILVKIIVAEKQIENNVQAKLALLALSVSI
jgi:DNA polymerase III delta prime subunit